MAFLSKSIKYRKKHSLSYFYTYGHSKEIYMCLKKKIYMFVYTRPYNTFLCILRWPDIPFLTRCQDCLFFFSCMSILILVANIIKLFIINVIILDVSTIIRSSLILFKYNVYIIIRYFLYQSLIIIIVFKLSNASTITIIRRIENIK